MLEAKRMSEQIKRSERIFLVICTTFCVTLVLSNVIASKLVALPWLSLALPAGLLTYPITFMLTDLVAEVWGAKHARFMVIFALAMNGLMLAVISASVWMPAHQSWAVPNNPYGYADVQSYDTAYRSVFSIQSTMVVASMLAYLAGQLLDVTLFDRLRRWTDGRHLWLRNNVSTLLSQLVDTALVVSIYLFWVMGMSWEEGKWILLHSYAYKACFALVDTPFLYAAVGVVRNLITTERIRYA